jgi:hypothetical protein
VTPAHPPAPEAETRRPDRWRRNHDHHIHPTRPSRPDGHPRRRLPGHRAHGHPDGRDLARGGLAAQAIGATLTLTSALLPRWRDAAASGHTDDDPFASTSRHDQRWPKYHGRSTRITVTKVHGSRSVYLSQPKAVNSVIE